MLARNGDAGGVNLRKAGIGKVGALLVGAPDRLTQVAPGASEMLLELGSVGVVEAERVLLETDVLPRQQLARFVVQCRASFRDAPHQGALERAS